MAISRFWPVGKGDRAEAADDGPRKSANFVDRQRELDFGRTEEALLLLKAFEESGQGWFWSTDAEGRLTYLSASMLRSLGVAHEALRGSRFADLFVAADEEVNVRRTLPFLLTKQAPFEKVVLRAAAEEDERCWSVSGCPQFGAGGRFSGYRGSGVDVTEQRESSKYASQLAKYDALTGLPNRLRMAEVLEAILSAAEQQRRSCAVMLIDLDRFKQVNDTLGHPAGDSILKQVADRLLRIVGDREKAFRLGGDEFQVVLQGCEDRGVLGSMASEIIASLSQPYSVNGSRCTIGASVGIAIGPDDGRTPGELIRNADLALYASKTGGRGCFRFFSGELLQAAEDKRLLEEDLRDALVNGEIRLAYQPIVDARSNHITGVEALVRWEHPERGAISPALFIPIAEEADLIGTLGEWVLRKACEDAATWPGRLRVAVNVSPIQFMKETLPGLVLSALAGPGLAPDRLELEITEGVFLTDAAGTDAMFATLKEIGVRLALDDFGTGYSSLGYLRTAPFDKIKIDQTFVQAATLPESRNSAIIAAIVALADALNMETTAEGIEYMDQLQLIRNLGVSHVQGFVYSRAISSDELKAHLEGGAWSITPAGPSRQRSDRQAMYRRVGVIHGSRYESVLIRNLSASGALIEGLAMLAPGTLILLDFGDGQISFARVTRTSGRQQGIAFEQPLVSDGSGGFCASHRISPYLMRTIGLPMPGDPDRSSEGSPDPVPMEDYAARLGISLASQKTPADGAGGADGVTAAGQGSPRKPEKPGAMPTVARLAEVYLEEFAGDEEGRARAEADLKTHVLPRFGHLRVDQLADSAPFARLAAGSGLEGQPPGTADRLNALLGRLCALAVRSFPDAAKSAPQWQALFHGHDTRWGTLTADEAELLIEAAGNSHNRQLKFIIALLTLTGLRQSEILKARWTHVDLQAGLWRVPAANKVGSREVRLTGATMSLLRALPRWDECPFVIANPRTRKPYQSFAKSWEVARDKVNLIHVEIEDLRHCLTAGLLSPQRLVSLVLDPSSAGTPAGGDAGEEGDEPLPEAFSQAA